MAIGFFGSPRVSPVTVTDGAELLEIAGDHLDLQVDGIEFKRKYWLESPDMSQVFLHGMVCFRQVAKGILQLLEVGEP